MALTPQTADTKMNLEAVVECTAYKLYDKTILDNDYHTMLFPNQTHFELQRILDHSHAGEEICLKQLGLKTIEELL